MIEVTLKDGRVLEIEAPDMSSALRAAQSFVDRESAQKRIAVEDAQRGPVGHFMKDVRDGTMQIASGIPLVGGLMDEGNAAFLTGGGLWGDYGKELEYQRESQRQAAERHPIVASVNNFAGGIGSGGAMLKAMPARATALMPTNPIGKLSVGAGTGASGGAVEGFTRGEGGFDNRVSKMGPSAAWGIGLGMAFPAVAKGLGMSYNAAASWLANRGVDAKSINILLDRLKAQGVTPQQVQARIAELGDDAMLADVTPGMQAFTGGTAIADIGAGNTIGQRLATRREGGGDRVQTMLDDAFGRPADPYAVKQEQRTIRNQAAFDEGRNKVLKPGPNTMTLAELDARIAQSSDPENAFRQQGVRTEIDRITGNALGDPGARVDRVMNRDWNDRKITRMIGPEKSRNLGRGLDAQATFTETSNLAEPARQSRAATIDAARDFWNVNKNANKGRPGTLSDMLAAGAGTAAATGSLKAGGTAALVVGANRLGHALGNVLARKSPELIQTTAESLTETGSSLQALARLLAEKTAELPRRSQAAKNIEMIAQALLATQVGRAGYETQRYLGYGGPR